MIKVAFKGEFEACKWTLKQLAEYYQIDKRTLKKMMQPWEAEIGPRKGNYYTVEQVKIIIDNLGINSVAYIVNTPD